MTDEERPRTAAATAARRRIGEEKRAEFLRARGWTVTPTGEAVCIDGENAEDENTNRA